MSLYDDLGIPPDATADDVKKAYRRKAHKAHPDKPGGNAEKFHAVQKAYDVLSDAARRANYDKTGDASDPGESLEQRAMKEIANAMITAVEQCPDLDGMNLVQDVRNAVMRSKKNHEQGIHGLEQRIARHEKAVKKIKRKKGAGPNLLANMVQSNIAGLRRGIAMAKENIELGEKMLAILADYDYEAIGGSAGRSPMFEALASFSPRRY